MKMRIPARLGVTVVGAIVGVALAGCGETPVGPDRQSGSTEATASTVAPAHHRSVDLGSCDSLRATGPTQLVAKLHARGYQIYRWDGVSWVFVEPSARLFAGRHARRLVGTHSAGPTWESRGGSKVVGTVVRRCTPNANAIPWLLLSAVPNQKRGIFHGVTQIQRLETVGGLAPQRAGTFTGELSNVPYTADYAFYRAR